MTTAAYTANFGGYDVLLPQAEQDTSTEWIAFTDDPRVDAPEPWRVVVVEGRFDHPRMSAKWFKCQPWLAIPHRWAVWIDANMEVVCPSFVREAIASIHDGVATWRHPERDCIFAEAAAALELAPEKYAHLPIDEQVDAYRGEGHPVHAGLYACGTVAWDTADERAQKLGAAWFAECETWSYEDQISLPVVARRLGVTPGVFPLEQIGWRGRRKVLRNRWMRLHPHLSNR
jgi:alkaline ceramidase TOD1/glycosyltransferase MUCI70-like protein